MHGARKGFKLTSLDGKITGTLANVEIKGPHRVGKYGVDLFGFEQFLESLRLLESLPCLAIVDEIGKMECLSEKFRELVTALLNAPVPVVATIPRLDIPRHTAGVESAYSRLDLRPLRRECAVPGGRVFYSRQVEMLEGAPLAKKAGGFIDEVKHRPDVRLYEITERNRDRLLSEIADIVRSLPVLA